MSTQGGTVLTVLVPAPRTGAHCSDGQERRYTAPQAAQPKVEGWMPNHPRPRRGDGSPPTPTAPPLQWKQRCIQPAVTADNHNAPRPNNSTL